MAKTSKSKSLDDIFADTPKKGNIKNPLKVNTNTSLDSLFPKEIGDPNQSGEGLNTLGAAMFVPFARGMTGGYSDRVMPKGAKDEASKLPVVSAISNLMGSIGPGMAAAKGVQAIGKSVPFLSALSKGGAAAGATEGAILGGASDPGENGSRLQNAGMGTILGGGLGLISKYLHGVGRQKDISDQMLDPSHNLPKEIKSKYDEAINGMMANEVTPVKEELMGLLKDKSVNINPDYLRGFERPALKGAPRDKGGLNVLADILERKNGVGGQSEIPATRAQDLKEYFQQSSNFSKKRPLSPSSEANNAKSDDMRRYMKDKISALDPNVDKLNSRMQESLNLKDQLQPQFEQDPILAVSQKPSTTKGNLLQQLDQKSGSSLADYGKDVRGAKAMTEIKAPELSTLGIPATYNFAKRELIGPLGQGVSKLPKGTRQSIIESILQNIKQSQDETDNIE